jgi:hypothetical protein
MKDDPIVEEAREAGQKYIDSFNGDWAAIIADLRRRASEEARQTIAPPPRRPVGWKEPAKKAG